MEIGFELKMVLYTVINYYLSQKFKLLGNGEFNHLAIILIRSKPYKTI